jgi:hypothetical protein
MWRFAKREVGADSFEAEIAIDDGRLAFDDFLTLLAEDPDFRRFFTGALRTTPFAAFAFEAVPITPEALVRPFRCALIDSPALDRVGADPTAFSSHFDGEALVTAFENTGGDAVLVAPSPGEDLASGAHLAAFLRGASEEQIHALWKAVAAVVRSRIGPQAIWLSTAGLGVSWLHVRVDTVPKYYRTAAWKDPAFLVGLG